MGNKDLGLKNLRVPEFDGDEIRKTVRENEAKRQEYRNKYGDDWYQKWCDHISGRDLGYDRDIKLMNGIAYHEGQISVIGTPGGMKYLKDKFEKRMREICGDAYDEIKRTHKGDDPRVAALLIEEAIRTGKWQELPDELLDEYKQRAGSDSN